MNLHRRPVRTFASPQRVKRAGFSLIEVLVAMVVLSVGLFGLAALQVTSLRNGHGAQYRSQAVFLVEDIMDRMRANRAAAMTSHLYDRNFGDATTNSATVAQKDLKNWNDSVAVRLPSGDSRICRSSDPNAADPCAVAGDYIVVQLRWSDVVSETTEATAVGGRESRTYKLASRL